MKASGGKLNFGGKLLIFAPKCVCAPLTNIPALNPTARSRGPACDASLPITESTYLTWPWLLLLVMLQLKIPKFRAGEVAAA